MSTKIILVGMPGSGKSTVGKELSLHLNLSLIDLDHEIEQSEGKKVKDIFSERGENYFREVESKTLHAILGTASNFVLATGGGAPCFHGGMGIINRTGTSIFLDVSVEELAARVENDKARPLLQSGTKQELIEKLNAIRNKRLSCYQQANITVHNSTLQDVLLALSKT